MLCSTFGRKNEKSFKDWLGVVSRGMYIYGWVKTLYTYDPTALSTSTAFTHTNRRRQRRTLSVPYL